MLHSLRKLLSKAWRCGITRLLYWFFILPMQCCLPIKKKSIVLIGKYGSFSDNVKYLFLHINNLGVRDIEVTYFVKDRKLYKLLRDKGLPVLLHPTPKSIVKLIRCAVIFVAGNLSKFDNLSSSRAYRVQLWHGAGMKKGGSLRKKQFGASEFMYKMSKAIGFQVRWSLAVSPSPFYSKIFAERFNPEEIAETGFPRNDCLFREATPFELIGSDAELIARANSYKEQGYRIILYAPTFRDTGGDAISDGVLNLQELSNFSKENKIIFIFKMHPQAKNAKELFKFSNVWEYNKKCDIYPMMRLVDLLITDYSSIYMDYNLLNRPIIFFPYDYDKYVQKDRDIAFDYGWITPGLKCHNQAELQQAVKEFLVDKKDAFEERRKEICDLAFAHKDGLAAHRLFEFLQQKM